jgi:hypothetical protein
MKVLALMSNKVYVMYVNGTGSGKILGKLYDSGWSAEQTAVNHTVGVTAWAAVANGDVIEVVSTDGTWRSETRSAAGAWSEADIAASATQNPTLTLLASGDLISSCNSSNHLYRISRTGGAWGSFIDWIDESGDGGLNAERTAVTVHQSNKIGILYKTKTASAYNVKFVYYDTVVAPTVTTEIASGVAISIEKETTGTLNGTLVNMGGAASCDVSFEYGLTTGYGSSTTPVTETGTGPFTASIPIDLIEGTTYHFRAVGVNAGGTGYGGDETFTIPYYSNRFIGLTPFVQVCPLIVLSLFIGGGIVVFIFGVKKRNPLFFVFAFVTISVGMLLYMIIITAVERIL